uniref:Uncharacterized protein n=1 Tax=Zea mays TaxID=4577 RepID=A0A804RJ35_MAIZE
MAPTTTLIVTVNLECCRCSSKIQKILCGIQQEGEFTIEKIVYEKDKVLVTGPFDADKLSCKLWCKAGRIIKDIQVAKPKDEKPKNPSCKLVYPYYPCYPFQLCPQQQPGAWPCSGGCPHPHCGCQSKPPPPPVPPPPPPPPPPPMPPACQCSTWPSCYCGGYPPPMPPSCQCSTWPSCYCGGYPPPMPYPMIVCDDSPPYGACTVM